MIHYRGMKQQLTESCNHSSLSTERKIFDSFPKIEQKKLFIVLNDTDLWESCKNQYLASSS